MAHVTVAGVCEDDPTSPPSVHAAVSTTPTPSASRPPSTPSLERAAVLLGDYLFSAASNLCSHLTARRTAAPGPSGMTLSPASGELPLSATTRGQTASYKAENGTPPAQTKNRAQRTGRRPGAAQQRPPRERRHPAGRRSGNARGSAVPEPTIAATHSTGDQAVAGQSPSARTREKVAHPPLIHHLARRPRPTRPPLEILRPPFCESNPPPGAGWWTPSAPPAPSLRPATASATSPRPNPPAPRSIDLPPTRHAGLASRGEPFVLARQTDAAKVWDGALTRYSPHAAIREWTTFNPSVAVHRRKRTPCQTVPMRKCVIMYALAGLAQPQGV